MSKYLTISQLAARFGLSAHTLRYYERIGLLDPVGRDSSGHRVFVEKDLLWIEFLLRLRSTGMPIRRMQRYAELRRQGETTLAARRQLLEEHRQAVARRLDELGRSLAALDGKIDIYRQLEDEVSARESSANRDQQPSFDHSDRSEHDRHGQPNARK
ncbi:transcriptional regulator, MerR family [Azotobacter vinelandii CA]|uniref:Transcriptional regulator, MerR family n=2 Tax=Azotobacter vinelandii TaxID=354 RepID=C1DH89_AZOVD|nr:MerR family transcriptional regulator [Azotobacter vinelandii]ACO76496.1 transcriptional regulator, MerR family [Azotobacter vinelandii DJ]AGK17377.1 transcriptional regulator, MerR family [Azotobacter vinelandii CA]AGK19166.1 transcriptional regulator, MerR family [Azotobacter vinelandii CA6]WKN22270.1 MerR family transcriptional regulator [Azotobacter vinelandii]SFX09332.1 DNA-binding transcriptional regulator, MerR family [Azotobacter vinelandii]